MQKVKTNNFIKKYLLILLLSFFIVVLTVTKISYKPEINQNPTQIVVVSPTPTIEINIIETKNNYPLEKILPYSGINFNILNYSKPLTLVVKVKSKDQDKTTKEMLDLFEKQGIDIESHKFEWEEYIN